LPAMRARILRRASMSCAEAPSPSRLTSNIREAVCSTSGALGPAPVPAEGWMAEADGLAGSGASEGEGGLTPEPWWLRHLPIGSSPCGLGFFHEVGAKLLVEVGPEGGRRHSNPLIATLPPLLFRSYFQYSRRGREMRKYLTEQEMQQGNS
jgi:hypothetical protein